jgi:hypothetical protein
MLPAGFSPQRVRVSLKGPFGVIEKNLNWEVTAAAASGPDKTQSSTTQKKE